MTRQRSALRPWLVVAFVVLALGAIIAASCSSSNQGAASSTTAATAGAATTVNTAGSSTTAGGSSTTASADQGASVLQMTTPSGTKSFTLAELEGHACRGRIRRHQEQRRQHHAPAKYKGVAVMDVLNAAGGLPAGTGVSFIAKDGYEMTMSADQVENGKFTTYDVSTGDEITIQDPLQLVFAYEKEGKPLDPNSEGTLRLVILSPQANQVTDGHWWVKWVNKVEVKTMAAAWTLALERRHQRQRRPRDFRLLLRRRTATASPGRTRTAQSGPACLSTTCVGRVDDADQARQRGVQQRLGGEGLPDRDRRQQRHHDHPGLFQDRPEQGIHRRQQVERQRADAASDAPLRLVGPAVKIDQSVGGIKEIRLLIK